MLKIILSIFIFLLIIVSPTVTFADWPMFRNDYSHSGSSQYEITKQPTLIWSSGNIGAAQGSLNVDADGTVYAGTSTTGLVALDSNGSQKWTQNSTAPITSSVFDSQGNIYFSVSGCNPFVYSYSKTGQKIWEYNLRPDGSSCGQYTPSGPIAISKDKQTLYTGRGFPGNTLMAFNINGTLKWEAGLSGQGPNGSLTIADSGNLYIGTGGNGWLISLNENGIQRWSRVVGFGPTVRINTPILDENENVYVTTSGVNGGELLVSYTSAGTKRWQYQILNSVFAGNAAYKNGVVYIIERDTLSAIDATNGSLKWKWNPPNLPNNRSLTSPVVDKLGNIIITGSNTLYIISPEGQVKWATIVADDLGSPVISDDNTIYTFQSLSNAGFIHKLKAAPDPTPTPSPTPIPTKTPLILIPGIGGSELKVNEDTNWSAPDGHGGIFNHNYLKDEKVWVNELEVIKPGNDDYFDVLRMKQDGINSEANISLTGNLAISYQDFINFFINNGYKLDQDLFIFPYDWRKDLSATSQLLDQKIQQIKQQTNAEKVDVISHSMGGLVGRNYILNLNHAQNIRKLFVLGTPHLGAPEFLKDLRYGGCLKYSVGPFCLTLAPLEMKDVLQNIISGYQLSPSQIYFNFYNNSNNQYPYPYKDNSGSLNYQQIKSLLTLLGYNTSLFSYSENFHSLDNTLTNTNGVEVTVIAGSGLPTLGQIIEKQTTDFFGNRIIHRDQVDINGDGTVPLFSASLNDPSKNLSLLGSAKVFYTKQDHGKLVTDGPALQLVKNILDNNSQLPIGVSSQAYSLDSGRLLSVHSPVNIHVYDTNGNHTGPTSEGFETNIPGSSYEVLDDAKFIYLPDEGNYSIKFEATDKGAYDFKIRKFKDDVISEEVIYKDIPLTNSTKAETEFNTISNQAPTIQVDSDGNGITDSIVNPTSIIVGNSVNDLTSPQTIANISGIDGLNGWYKSDVKITLNTEDEASGSGILKTEYSLDDGKTIQTYNEPFIISKEGINKLKFRSIDKAGNEENAKELDIKIDKNAPEAKVYVDLDKLDLAIEGIDISQTKIERLNNTETKKKDDAIYKIIDEAGNTLKIDVRERDKEKQDKFRIYSLQYNDNTSKILDNNHYNVTYQGTRQRLNVKEQNYELEGDVKIRIQYNKNKNQSTIIVREENKEKVKEIKNGLILLKVLTNNGELNTQY